MERNAFLPSLLDRLQDDDPLHAVESDAWQYVDIARHKAAVARDLEALLNTRCLCLNEMDPDIYPLCRQSILGFGIMDLSGLCLRSPQDQMRLKQSIEATIARHEPRLSELKVDLEIPESGVQTLRFRVDGLLVVHPDRPAVSFDAFLHLSSSTYKVKG